MYLSIYRYRVQELTDDQDRDGTVQPADEDGTQSEWTQARAGHDEHTQKDVTRA